MSRARRPTAWVALAAAAACWAVGCQNTGERTDGVALPAAQRHMLNEAERYKQEGLYEAALAAFEIVLEDNPRAVDAHLGVGDIYEVRGDYEKAAEKYASAKQINPGNFKAVYKLGLMYHLLDRVRDAIKEYLAALAIDPANFEANLNLATAYQQIGEAQMGLPYAEAAVELRPENQNAHVNLGSIYAALGEHHLAIEQYRAAAELGDLRPPIAMNMANSLVKTGAYQRAINVLRLVANRQPDVTVYERLGYAHFKLGQFDESLEHYRTALDYDAEDTAALNGVGVNLMTKYLRGRREDISLREQAIETWRRSVRIDPTQDKIVNLISRYRKL